MREYKQLTEEERIEIYAMMQAGKQQNMIAAELGVHSSTVMITLRRLAPAVVLLVRPPLRISASRRTLRSLRLFVSSTSGCSTKTNRQFRLSTNSFCNRMNVALWSAAVSPD